MIDKVAMRRWDDFCVLEHAVSEGVARGRQEGRVELAHQMIQSSLKAGLSIDLISKITSLNVREIEDIKKQLPLHND